MPFSFVYVSRLLSVVTKRRPITFKRFQFKRDKDHVIDVDESCRSAAVVITSGQQVAAFHRRSVKNNHV